MEFRRADGSVLTLTQDPDQPHVWHGGLEDGRTVADLIHALHDERTAASSGGAVPE